MVNDFGQLELGFDVEIENYENTAKKKRKRGVLFQKGDNEKQNKVEKLELKQKLYGCESSSNEAFEKWFLSIK